MSDKPSILVVGSINMDMVVRTRVFPAPSETVMGEGFTTSPGGKGANQAVAAARLGARCRMIGRIGDDAFGAVLLQGLKAEGVGCEHVLRTSGVPSGVAVIVVSGEGENTIVVAGGANLLLTPDDIFPLTDLFQEADVLLLQLELPLPTVRAAIQLARRHGCKIILDPAPAPRQMCSDLFQVDILSPNASEAEKLTGQMAIEERVDKNVALDLIARGATAVVLKMGPRGALVVTNDGHMSRVPTYKVNVVDTTAAGDAFTAALGVSVAQGVDLPTAAKIANAAGALACTRLGAQSAMPTGEEVRILMRDQPL